MRNRTKRAPVWLAGGWVLIIAGPLLATALVLVLRALSIGGLPMNWWGYDRLTAVLISLCIIAGGASVVYGRRLRAVTAVEMLAADPRPEVLYLRSFEDDRKIGAVVEGFADTVEQRVGRAFRPIGPFLGIGDPREELPRIGASREYIDDAGWKQRASQRIAEAALVTVLAGGGPGLAWEMSELLRLRGGDPDRVLLLVAHKRDYESFRSSCGRLFPKPLPEWHRSSWGPRRTVQGIIEFGSDWSPLAKPFPTWRLVLGGVARSLEVELRETYIRLGGNYRVPLITLHEAFMAALLVLALGAVLLVMFVS